MNALPSRSTPAFLSRTNKSQQYTQRLSAKSKLVVKTCVAAIAAATHVVDIPDSF